MERKKEIEIMIAWFQSQYYPRTKVKRVFENLPVKPIDILATRYLAVYGESLIKEAAAVLEQESDYWFFKQKIEKDEINLKLISPQSKSTNLQEKEFDGERMNTKISYKKFISFFSKKILIIPLTIILLIIYLIIKGGSHSNSASWIAKGSTLIPYRSGDKWGYCDEKKNILIKPQFDKAAFFVYGVAPIRVGKLWGIISADGNIIVPPKFDYIEISYDGLIKADFESKGQWLFSLDGITLFEPKNDGDRVSLQDGGLASIYVNGETKSSEYVIDQNGTKIFSSEKDGARIMSLVNDGVFVVRYSYENYDSIIDINGKVIGTVPIDDFFGNDYKAIGNGLFIVHSSVGDGMVDRYGSFIIPIEKDIMLTESCNKIIIARSNKVTYKGMETRFQRNPDSQKWNKNRLYSKPDDKRKELRHDYWGAYNLDGKLIVPFIYSHLEVLCDNIIYTTENDKQGLLDLSGHKITQPLYDVAVYDAENYVAVNIGWKDNIDLDSMESSGLWGVIDSKGKIILPIKYKSSELSWAMREGLAPVKVNGLYGYLNVKDSLTILPEFEDAKSFVEGYAIVKKNSKMGLIDNKGKFVLNKMYDRIDEISLEHDCSCFSIVESHFNGRKNIIIVDPTFGLGTGLDLLEETYRASNISKKFFWVTSDGKNGLIEINGVEYFD